MTCRARKTKGTAAQRLAAAILTAAFFAAGFSNPSQARDTGSEGAGLAGSQFSVGETLRPDEIHIIRNPGRYGLATAPRGSLYAVAAGKLIRIDAQSLQVRSILRQQMHFMD